MEQYLILSIIFFLASSSKIWTFFYFITLASGEVPLSCYISLQAEWSGSFTLSLSPVASSFIPAISPLSSKSNDQQSVKCFFPLSPTYGSDSPPMPKEHDGIPFLIEMESKSKTIAIYL